MQSWAGNSAFVMRLSCALLSSSQFQCPLEVKLKAFLGPQGLTSNLDPRCFGRWEVVCRSKFNWMKNPGPGLLCTPNSDFSEDTSDIIIIKDARTAGAVSPFTNTAMPV